MSHGEATFATPEEILAHLEADMSPLGSKLTRPRLFQEAAAMFALRGDSDNARRCCAESVLFYAYAQEPAADDAQARYLGPLAVIEGRAFADPDIIPDAMLYYFEERVERTKNPYLKARYADFLWQRGRGHVYARESIAAHLQLVNREADQGRYHTATQSARRALSLAYVLGDKTLTNQVVASLTNTSERWVSSGADAGPGFVVQIVDKILGNRRFRDGAILDRWAGLLQGVLKLSTSHWTSVEVLRQLGRVYRRLGKQEGANHCRIQIAEAWEAEGTEQEARSWLVAAASYQDALKTYTEAGVSDKVREMKVKIRRAYRKAEETEFKPISQRFEVDMSDWDKQIGEWLNLEPAEAVRYLAAYLPLIPSWQQAEALTTKLEKEAPLSQLIPSVTVEDARPISQAASDEDRRLQNVRRQYNFVLISSQVLLSRAIGKFREDGALNADCLIDVIRESPFFDEEKIETIRSGFERYVEGDYVSALHILVPHLEDCLRRLLGKLGGDVTSVRAGKMREKPLDEVLATEEMKATLAVISASLWRYFEHVLVAETGMNLRNKVAHGLLSREESSEGIANTVVHLYLILGFFRLKGDEAG